MPSRSALAGDGAPSGPSRCPCGCTLHLSYHTPVEQRAAFSANLHNAIMSASFEWHVQIRDRPGMLQTRFEHGARHMAYHEENRTNGRLVFSGPTLSSHQTGSGSPLEVTGSILVFRLSGGEEEVRSIIEDDPLAKAGVWDMERATITPFKLFRPQ